MTNINNNTNNTNKKLRGVTLNNKKSFHIAILNVFGIGKTTSKKICEAFNIEAHVKVSEITDQMLSSIDDYITTSNILVEDDQRKKIRDDINRIVSNGCYRGIRHRKGLPINSRTKTNAKTVKRLRARSGYLSNK